ncbi:14194_t:CDS:2 [Funneliformis caledonium]|uniref:14194_t:CDS:1 n=2 Tax=Funneliformis TaxID=1117308 RepID=A0A9N9ALC2_9GLOM|nr:10561_t:CDS:2 [Funneliformis mosseae]CAG8532109.1 14194_t:CDS:2 [Funneliformis caledonium]
MSVTSTTSDPKRPNSIVPYHPAIKTLDEIDPDLFGTFSLILSESGLIAKIKWATWLALIFAVVSITNEKASDQDPNNGRTSALTSLLFASSGLVINYMYLFMGIPGPLNKP